MALWELDEFKLPQFLGFVRNVPPPDQFTGNRFLPDRPVDDLEVEWIKGARENTVMAKVITYDAEAPIGGRPGLGERIRQELPPIKKKIPIREKEIIRFKQPRLGTDDRDRAIASVFEDTARLVRSIQARVEWLRLQALSEPTLSYSEDGVTFVLDYGIGFQFDVGVDADFSVYWDDTVNSDPITDLVTMRDKMVDKTGFPPERIVMSRKVRSYILQNQKARELIRGSGAPTQILSDAELNNLFQLYDLPEIVTYDVKAHVENADGTETQVNMMDYHRAFLLPSVRVGETLWGPTAEAVSELMGTTLAREAPGIIAKTYAEEDPPTEWIKAAAISLPSLPSAELVAQAEVLSGSV